MCIAPFENIFNDLSQPEHQTVERLPVEPVKVYGDLIVRFHFLQVQEEKAHEEAEHHEEDHDAEPDVLHGIRADDLGGKEHGEGVRVIDSNVPTPPAVRSNAAVV